MANWLERFLGKREGENASSSSGWTDEFPRADVATEQAAEAIKNQQNRTEAGKEFKRRPKIESAVRDLNESARRIRQTVESEIRKAITKGKTSLFFQKLTTLHSYDTSVDAEREIELILNRSIDSASELQSLLLYLRSKGYSATAFVHRGLSFSRSAVWLGINWEPVDPY